MKKIISQSRPVVMTTNREPLNLQLSITQRNGDPLTQIQDASNGLWSPNRSVTPLYLDVTFTAYDPEIGSNIPISASNIKWYVEEEKSWDSATETGLVNVSDRTANYYLENTSTLVVRKNINYYKPVTLLCIVTFTESGRSETYRAETSIMLSSENRPDDFYSCRINTPSVMKYRPLSDTVSLRTLKGVVYKGGEIVGAPHINGIKLFWYYLNSGTWTLIPTNGAYAPYVSGQNTDTLVLDAAYIDTASIKLMINTTPTYTAVSSPTGNPHELGYFELTGTSPYQVYLWTDDTSVMSGKTYYTISNTTSIPDQNCLARAEVVRHLPHLRALPYCTGGSSVKVDDSEMDFKVIVSADGKDLDSEKVSEFFRFAWKSKPTNSATVTSRGSGETCRIPASSLRQTGNVNVEVYPEAYVLSELQLLEYPAGTLLTDDSGSATASDNHGYVVGRT